MNKRITQQVKDFIQQYYDQDDRVLLIAIRNIFDYNITEEMIQVIKGDTG